MRIAITDFKGAAPKRSARLLPDNFAQIAQNTRLDGGAIEPTRLLSPNHVQGSPVQTIYRLQDNTWLAWNAVVNAVPGPIAADRLYYTGDGAPKMRLSDGNIYSLALTAPTNAPTVTAQSAVDPALAEDVIFAYTFLTDLNEESAPSLLSIPAQWSPGVVMRLTGLQNPPAGRRINRYRIYRSVTSATGTTDLYYVDEIASTATQYDHDLAIAPIQDVCPTADFGTPVSGLAGLTALPNGIMAAFSGRSLYFCEPYQPHAWPSKYALQTEKPIMGLAAFGSYLAVMTEGTPYRVQGTHPDNMTMEKIEKNLPCTSRRSIVDLGYQAVYASDSGLVAITASGAELISQNLFSKEQWSKATPGSIKAGRFDGKYFFSFGGTLNGVTAQAAAVDLTGTEPFMVNHEHNALAYYTWDKGERLFFLDAADGQTVYEHEYYNMITRLTAKWRSKRFITPQAVNFGALIVEASQVSTGTNAFVTVYADGVAIHTTTAINTPTRLPGVLGTQWEIEINTDMRIEAVTIASTMDELLSP